MLGCGSSSSGGANPGDSGAADVARETSVDDDAGALPPIGGVDRPVTVYVPKSYAAGKRAPLVILLHGSTATGALEDIYMNLKPQSEARGFLYAYPDGTENSKHQEFWNATEACCDEEHSGVDDSGYLARVIDDIAARFSVDEKRVYFVGHSNGGFMSYRMACDHADRVAAIGSLAGAMWSDVARCKPSTAVSVLEIHGTADDSVLYDGTASYPSAKTTAADWAAFDGCTSSTDAAATMDLVPGLAGAETTVTRWAGCRGTSTVELWTIAAGNHYPAFNATFAASLIDFLYAHPKP